MDTLSQTGAGHPSSAVELSITSARMELRKSRQRGQSPREKASLLLTGCAVGVGGWQCERKGRNEQ